MKHYLLLAVILLAGCKRADIEPVSNPSLSINRKANFAASDIGDVIGKITVGYQGWFSATGDGSPNNVWWHWAQDIYKAPSPTNQNIPAWPDMREYTTTFKTNYENLGNGQPATLFSSYTQHTVDTHFLWMQQNDIDCAALQRFNPTGDEGPIRDAVALKVRSAAEKFGRKFYIMYDLTDWTNCQTEIKTDWTNKMKTLTSSTSYAIQNGKPVVCMWGLGFKERPLTPAAELDMVNWFKSKGCYVIGGVPHEWRDNTVEGPSNFDAVFKALDMINPWMVGAIGDIAGSDQYYTYVNTADVAYCKANNIAFQGSVLPGGGKQRVHGDFMWHEFYNMIRVGAQGIYVSMFDEFGEGNQIAKTAEDASMKPTNSAAETLDIDGIHCSSDYYLRLTRDGGRMLKGQIALTSFRPTEPVIGGGGAHLPPIGRTITLIGWNQNYVSGENALKQMSCNHAQAGSWESFTVEDAGNGKVALKSMGSYVSSENGQNPMTCNRSVVGESEKFDYITNADGTVCLRGNNGLYVSAENGTNPMTCYRDKASIWETFKTNL